MRGWLEGSPPTTENMVSAAEALNALWSEIIDSQDRARNPSGAVDYEACFRALGGDGEELLRACRPIG